MIVVLYKLDMIAVKEAKDNEKWLYDILRIDDQAHEATHSIMIECDSAHHRLIQHQLQSRQRQMTQYKTHLLIAISRALDDFDDENGDESFWLMSKGSTI